MTTAFRGCLGVVKVKDLATTSAIPVVGGVQEWSLTQEAESIDASEIGTCTKASVAGANSRQLSLSGFWNPSAGANQSEITVGNVVAIELYPAGTGSGNEYFATTTGGATVGSVENGGSVDGLVSFSATLTINGDFPQATAT